MNLKLKVLVGTLVKALLMIADASSKEKKTRDERHPTQRSSFVLSCSAMPRQYLSASTAATSKPCTTQDARREQFSPTSCNDAVIHLWWCSFHIGALRGVLDFTLFWSRQKT